MPGPQAGSSNLGIDLQGSSFRDIRDEVAKLCASFPGEYWRRLDRETAYPVEFVRALGEA